MIPEQNEKINPIWQWGQRFIFSKAPEEEGKMDYCFCCLTHVAFGLAEPKVKILLGDKVLFAKKDSVLGILRALGGEQYLKKNELNVKELVEKKEFAILSKFIERGTPEITKFILANLDSKDIYGILRVLPESYIPLVLGADERKRLSL